MQALPTARKGLEQQIEICEQILETLSPGEEREFWAAVQNRLGIACTERRRRKPGDNVEKAIAAYTAALEVLSPEKSPIDWAMARNSLGAACSKRAQGDRAE